MGGVPPPPGAGGSRSISRGTRPVSHPPQGSASSTTLSFVHRRTRGVARAAGGLSRPQRGDPRRGSPLYPLLRFFGTGEFRALRRAARGAAPGPRPLFCKKAGQKTFKRQSISGPSPSPLGRVIQSVREADTLAAEWHLPREWERRVGPETSRGRHHPKSAFLWGSTPFLWARPKKWGGFAAQGKTNQQQFGEFRKRVVRFRVLICPAVNARAGRRGRRPLQGLSGNAQRLRAAEPPAKGGPPPALH